MERSDDDRLDQVADPEIRRFVAYWRRQRGGARYPARADLDPLDFRYVLGDVVIIEAHRSAEGSPHPWEYRYRLIGASVASRDGYDLTNKTLDELPEPQYRERVRQTWTEVCETGCWVHHIRELILDGRLRRYEVVVMPLAGNHEDIDMLISVQKETPLAPLCQAACQSGKVPR